MHVTVNSNGLDVIFVRKAHAFDLHCSHDCGYSSLRHHNMTRSTFRNPGRTSAEKQLTIASFPVWFIAVNSSAFEVKLVCSHLIISHSPDGNDYSSQNAQHAANFCFQKIFEQTQGESSRFRFCVGQTSVDMAQCVAYERSWCSRKACLRCTSADVRC